MARVSRRFLVLSQFFPPEPYAAAKRMAAMADALATRHQVTVATLEPGYPSAADYAHLPVSRLDRERGYEVTRRGILEPHRASDAHRAAAELRMATRLAARGLGQRCDVVLASSPSMFLGPAGLALARARGARFVWDVRDITWDYAAEARTAGGLSGSSISALRRLMWSIVPRADLVLAATPGIAATLSACRPDARVRTVANAVVPEELLALSPRERGEHDRPRVTYVGLVGDAQRLAVLLAVAERMPEVAFSVVGRGPERAHLEARASERGLRNVEFTAQVNPARLLDHYRAADILFAQVRSTPTLDQTAMPSKLMEYMASGRPLIYAGNGHAAAEIERIGSGLAVPPEEPRAIETAIEALLGDPRRAVALGAAGREYARARREERVTGTALLAAIEELES
jgi:glycosyltransferase involved in cell wall biosynthesis